MERTSKYRYFGTYFSVNCLVFSDCDVPKSAIFFEKYRLEIRVGFEDVCDIKTVKCFDCALFDYSAKITMFCWGVNCCLPFSQA